MKYKIGFIGAGKMAEGILSAIKNKRSVIMAEKQDDRIDYLKNRYKVKVVKDIQEVVQNSQYVFIAVKPQDIEALREQVRPYLAKGQTLVSIAAGKSLKNLRKTFGPKAKLIRVMPNLALRAKAGMCVLTSHDEFVEEILSAAGEVLVLPEKYFDVVTALSGSGPAYFAFMQQSMAEAAVKLGLPKAAALKLSEQTMYGTAKFLKENDCELGAFIAGVCTKGGTTAAGMAFLEDSDFAEVVARTIKGASDRSKELNS